MRRLTLCAALVLPGCELPYVPGKPVDSAAPTAPEADSDDSDDSDTDDDDSAADSGEPASPVEVRVALDGPRLLRRVSLDLTGTLPPLEALDAVEADPDAWRSWRDAWLEDAALEETLVMLLAEQWHTRIDEFLIFYLEYGAINDDPEVEYAFERSVGEEPLRLAARIVMEDRPWTEVVTADHTMANPLLSSIWPIDHPGGEGWQPSTYTDGRPAAGILSTNGLWWRYYTTVTNYNRGRVAAITRTMVCDDFASRSISFDDNEALSAGADAEEAIRTSPSCMGCHEVIDPIAATLFGFWSANEYNTAEVDHYHPDREDLGPEILDKSPGWYGRPVYGLNELGQYIAADARFSRCAVETFAKALWRRGIEDADSDVFAELDAAFLATDHQVRPLLSELTETLAYQVGSFQAGASLEQMAPHNELRMLRPDQLSRALHALTGFSWTWKGYEQLDNDTLGFRIMAGGVDGTEVTQPQHAPSLTSLLVLQRLSEGAAEHLVDAELIYGEDTVLDGIDAETRPGDAAFDDKLRQLHWRLYAVRADDAWMAQISALWQAVHEADGTRAAWEAVVAAMLQDPLFVGY